ncbi:Fungal specific transcription factor domain-containing protein 16 [Elsinoe fawcettii]|nr:Fungal specific transcription factor domain-containing protein 16 [Elsinoe fawcettii]
MADPSPQTAAAFDPGMTPNMDSQMFDWLDMDMGGFDDLSLSMIQQSLAMADTSSGGTSIPCQEPFPLVPPPNESNGLPDTTVDSRPSFELPRIPARRPSPNRGNTGSLEASPPQQISSPVATGLLGTFYRLSVPSTTAKFSGEDLVQYYFSEVCPLYSCFDSKSNPFRKIVGDLWTTSATVYLAIQSMAVAHLSNHYLYMVPIGHAKKSQAWKSLQLDLRLHRAGKLPLETVLMGLLLLGLSSPWHRPADLGLKYLFISRNLIQNYLRGERNRGPQVPIANESFYLDALMYWEMLASFVDPVYMTTFPGFGAPTPQTHKEDVQITPHAWAGIQSEIHFAVAEVGRLLRRRRRYGQVGPADPSISSKENGWCSVDEAWAVDLERFLNKIQIPNEDSITEYGDDNTPKTDLVQTARANRLMGLLEIYAAFPHWLQKRIGMDPKFSASFGHNFATTLDHSCYQDPVESWLCAISLHILDHLRDIPISSSSCRLHPLILISCASQLRFPDQATPDSECADVQQDQVFDGREWIEARMLGLSRKYPQKQQLQILDIIKETWQKLDDKSPGAYWLDVTHENGWQTMMG